MIKSFFQRLDSLEVDYLLISGQATILYGAATFSEDVDLWIESSDENRERFLHALRESRATYYKLTPPFTARHLARGHGFHFVMPDEPPSPDVFLDVMGKPPRAGAFATAAANARTFDTDFGRIRTVGIRELVELKKTQRASDYPVIGRLALALIDESVPPPGSDDHRWALDSVFGLAEFVALVRHDPAGFAALAGTVGEPVSRAVLELSESDALSTELEDELDAYLEARASELRRADRRYWKSIIDELRELRRAGALVPEGTSV